MGVLGLAGFWGFKVLGLRVQGSELLVFVIRSREVQVQGFAAFWKSAARGKVSAEGERGGGGSLASSDLWAPLSLAPFLRFCGISGFFVGLGF